MPVFSGVTPDSGAPVYTGVFANTDAGIGVKLRHRPTGQGVINAARLQAKFDYKQAIKQAASSFECKNDDELGR